MSCHYFNTVAPETIAHKALHFERLQYCAFLFEAAIVVSSESKTWLYISLAHKEL
jgi:hypothetical protein